MAAEKPVPRQLEEVCEELMRNWCPPVHVKIAPFYEEHDFGASWRIKITIRDFTVNFPWNEHVDLKMVADIYGFIFRSMCYALEDAILKGVNVGVEIRQTALIQSIGQLVEAESDKLVNRYRHGLL